ncbi:hypothetical protein V8G54_032399 [Vigna mungo]|uniref:Uncharacterized protein n=1 Tax=Vigna mungo TaxID=3915 RepID=A0AAQ3RGM9_VIGMU
MSCETQCGNVPAPVRIEEAVVIRQNKGNEAQICQASRNSLLVVHGGRNGRKIGCFEEECMSGKDRKERQIHCKVQEHYNVRLRFYSNIEMLRFSCRWDALSIKIVYRSVGNGDSDNSWLVFLMVMNVVVTTPYGSAGLCTTSLLWLCSWWQSQSQGCIPTVNDLMLYSCRNEMSRSFTVGLMWVILVAELAELYYQAYLSSLCVPFRYLLLELKDLDQFRDFFIVFFI